MPALDDAKLLTTRVRMEAMWGDAQVRKNFTAKAETLNAILSHQTATGTLLTGRKDADIEVNWLSLADQTVTTFNPATGYEICNLDGPELEAGKKPYTLSLGAQKSFTVVEDGSADKAGLRGLDAEFEEMVARGLLQTRKALVEHANKSAIAKLDSYTGTNKYTAGPYADDTTTPTGDTIIPAADYGVRKLLPYLARVQQMNNYLDPYILDGGLLWDDIYLAQVGAVGDAQVKLQALTSQFDITEDLFGFSAAGVEDRSYLVDRSAVAFFSKNHYPTGGIINRSETRKDYTIALPELGNRVYADVEYQYKCEANVWKHVWQLSLRYDLLDNPTIGDAALTGVLAFRKGA